MTVTKDDFNKIWASTSSVPTYTFSDTDYQNGWEFVGNLPPTRAMWDELQRRNDEKMQLLYTGASFWVDSVADLRSADAEVGNVYATKGYYAPNDGGNGFYVIRADAGDTDDGGSIIILENGNVAELITDGTVYVEQFGAKGDGTTDDLTSIQKAIDFGETVVFSKTYMISAGILLHSNLNMVGNNKGKIVKDPATTTHFSALYWYDTNNTLGNVTIKGLSIEGLKHWTGVTISGTANDFGIRLWNTNNVKVEGCNVSECGGCAISVNGTNVKIEKNIVAYTGTFTGNPPNYNFGISYGGENYIISRNTISGVIQGIISGLTNNKVRITENDISTNGQHGLYMESGIDVVVANNNIHDCTLTAIKFQATNTQISNMRQIVVDGNSISNCGGQGVFFVELGTAPLGNVITNCTISNNTILSTARAVEVQSVKHFSVVGNVMENCAQTIRLSNISAANISNNSLTINNSSGILYTPSDLYDEDGVIISNNSIIMNTISSSTGIFGIEINTGNNVVISNNVILKYGDGIIDGLYVHGDKLRSLYILDNVIKGFRWDLRGAYIPETATITLGTNYYNTKTGL